MKIIGLYNLLFINYTPSFNRALDIFILINNPDQPDRPSVFNDKIDLD